jgi:hypothetical protein
MGDFGRESMTTSTTINSLGNTVLRMIAINCPFKKVVIYPNKMQQVLHGARSCDQTPRERNRRERIGKFLPLDANELYVVMHTYISILFSLVNSRYGKL